MDPIEILMNEHGLIRSYLDNLNKAVVKLENGEKPPRAFFEKAVAFSREFADKFHHFKEEHLMFVRLAAKKRGAVDAQIDALRYQHERGRELVTQIEGSLAGYGEYRPVAPNDSPEGKARNRRVDIVILDPDIALMEPVCDISALENPK